MLLSPIVGFLIGFPVALAICALPIKGRRAEALRKTVGPGVKGSAFVASIGQRPPAIPGKKQGRDWFVYNLTTGWIPPN